MLNALAMLGRSVICAKALPAMATSVALAICSSAHADTITVTPSAPTAADLIRFRVDGISDVSPAGPITSSLALQGSTLRLEGCTNDLGFDSPGTYFINYSVSGLKAGVYSVQYFHAYCALDGTVVIPYVQTAVQLVTVAPAGAAIPALSIGSLVALTVVVVLLGAMLFRRA